MSIPGVKPSTPSELGRVDDRITFVYLEHAVIARDANALTATSDDGIIHIPSAGLLVLMLGPGTKVTHQAMTVLADSGAAIVWVGEQGVRYYAGGRPLARSTRLLEKQAKIVSNSKQRIAVAREMYLMRFTDEDVAGLSMQQLRGREGARVRNVYREQSRVTGVPWNRREYEVDDFDASDLINQALSAANSCLYGVVHAAVVALGCSAGLGIVHTGHDRSFVYDIADLYKAETSIPVAFECVAIARGAETEVSGSELSSMVRRRMRDAFVQLRIVERIVTDIKRLFAEGDNSSDNNEGSNDTYDEVRLWDARGSLPSGQNYEDDERGF
ncbi:type I-E CRISPR-associated endonuclease Cas1 [Leucobacter insecticola]|uniref:CRISPR-associated endonuclease Cas1 n=1 Tax=Leucobacter insecticola TaxID=2714934 RepID=A0A6G8FH09_9MICO|nr:type I-E CRISPR-associated endonuclease Cas1e [Leucobacter insecticola]QIM15750.1 type I-E CRISPR-associated endonuclease Cas1 [Leucobacter insecticola]